LTQFIYFVCQESNKDLLKEEIKLFHSNLSLSFSKGGFLTFKNNSTTLTPIEIQKIQPAFAIEWGESTAKLDDEHLSSKLSLLESNSPLPSEAPSRAYLKIKEACDAFQIVSDHKLNWIEFGSAPGGASYYLLKYFNQVIGVDPAEMSSLCLVNRRFIHLKKPLQNLSERDLPNIPIHWITSDLNLNPKQAIKEVLRLARPHYSTLKGILMTVKMINTYSVKEIPMFEKHFTDAGFRKIKKMQLPSHKREFLLFASY
jgi:23S rRNA U2552 (ribose-2'-O)-methylase RlmE/FtsJ